MSLLPSATYANPNTPFFATEVTTGDITANQVTVGGAPGTVSITGSGTNVPLVLAQNSTLPTFPAQGFIELQNSSGTAGQNTRWRFIAGNPESGGNAGSDLAIASYSDTGAFLGYPMTITRSSGALNLTTPPIVNGNPIGAQLVFSTTDNLPPTPAAGVSIQNIGSTTWTVPYSGVYTMTVNYGLNVGPTTAITAGAGDYLSAFLQVAGGVGNMPDTTIYIFPMPNTVASPPGQDVFLTSSNTTTMNAGDVYTPKLEIWNGSGTLGLGTGSGVTINVFKLS